jgi:hypothetical protein
MFTNEEVFVSHCPKCQTTRWTVLDGTRSSDANLAHRGWKAIATIWKLDVTKEHITIFDREVTVIMDTRKPIQFSVSTSVAVWNVFLWRGEMIFSNSNHQIQRMTSFGMPISLWPIKTTAWHTWCVWRHFIVSVWHSDLHFYNLETKKDEVFIIPYDPDFGVEIIPSNIYLLVDENTDMLYIGAGQTVFAFAPQQE